MSDLVGFLIDQFSFLSEVPELAIINAVDGAFSDFNAFILAHKFDFFDEDDEEKLKMLNKLIEHLLKNVSSSGAEGIFSTLKEEICKPRNLCTFFWYGVEDALKNGTTFKALRYGILCARSYLLLSSLEGASAYDVYQPTILARCLDLWTKVLRIINGKVTSAKKKPSKSKKVVYTNEVEETIVLPPKEIKKLSQELSSSLDSLYIFMGKVSLAKPVENIHLCCRFIKDLIKCDVSSSTTTARIDTLAEFKEVLDLFSDFGFALLHKLCDPRHEAVKILYPSVVMPRIMYANILDDSFLPSSVHINVEMGNIAAVFINFVKKRLCFSNEEAETIYIMAVSACLKCPERAEYRTKILKSVMDIITEMDSSYKDKFVEHILIIGGNNRAGLRAFAIDTVQYIYNHFGVFNNSTSINSESDEGIDIVQVKEEVLSQSINSIEEESSEPKKDNATKLLRLVIDGIEDKVGIVRQRSLAILPLFLESVTYRNVCSSEIVELHKELRDLEIKKYKLEKDRRKKEKDAEKAKRIQSSNDNEDEEEEDICNDGEDVYDELDEEVPVFNPPQTQDAAALDNDKTLMMDKTATVNDETSEGNTTSIVKSEAEVDLNTTEINVQIVSDETGIFERKHVFKIKDYPLLNRILVRCDDRVSACRKNAIVALATIFPSLTNDVHVDASISQFCRSARDKTLSIRKQVAESIYSILCGLNEEHQYFKKVINCAMECIVLQVADREQSVQMNASKIIVDMVFLPLYKGELKNKIAWSILDICETVLTYQRILKQAISFLVKERLIDEGFVKALNKLMKQLDDETSRRYIWMILSILSVFFYVNPNDAANEFLSMSKSNVRNESKVCIYYTTIISRGAKDLNDDVKGRLIKLIGRYITSFRVSNNNISSLYYCYAVLLDGIDENSRNRREFSKRNREIFELAQGNMKLLMFEEYHGEVPEMDLNSQTMSSRNNGEGDGENVKLAKILGVIGEIIDYEPSLICKDLFEMLQLIMSSEICKKVLKITEKNNGGRGTAMSHIQTQQTSNRNDGRTTSLSIMREFSTHHIKYCNITGLVRAQCVIIMGKICLVDEIFARDVIPVFMKELVICKDYVIRNNIIVVTHDLCKQHTSLVGSYMNIFAACLTDDSVAVRVHALHCLTRLLKEGYLVWKGEIMFRFVSTLLDKVERVRDYAEFCLVDTLLPVTPDMFFANFIDCLFYFNGVEHPSWILYNQAQGDDTTSKVNKLNSLQGSCYQEQRLQLYCFMLKNMVHVQKVAITQKICIEVFEAIALELLNFNDINVQNMLIDSFKLLSSEDGKIRFNLGKDGDEEEDGDNARREAIIATANQASKEVLREVFVKEVMKYLIQLKDFLYSTKNVKCSYEFLKYLLHLSNEHNYAFEKILDEDKHLAGGLRYDLIRMQNKLDAEGNNI